MNHNRKIWVSTVFACLLLAASGVVYHSTAVRLDALAKNPLLPAMPLSSFPVRIGPWEGEDQPLSETTLQIAGNDDYVNRVYRIPGTEEYAAFYVSYTSQPRTMLGHRPDLCYVGAGWNLEQTETRQIQTSDGQVIPVLLHTFRKPLPDLTRLIVLNYYLINGQATNDHRIFSGLRWRLPSFSRGQVRYVAQIQVASTSLTSVLSFTTLAAPLIASYMPTAQEEVLKN
ncbi:MAG TPA: EpsI family protein [Anaerohalosphaeraceae bacterium]|nr:EpsI family protein [Anaerohalosphaeraceae bacterium]